MHKTRLKSSITIGTLVLGLLVLTIMPVGSQVPDRTPQQNIDAVNSSWNAETVALEEAFPSDSIWQKLQYSLYPEEILTKDFYYQGKRITNKPSTNVMTLNYLLTSSPTEKKVPVIIPKDRYFYGYHAGEVENYNVNRNIYQEIVQGTRLLSSSLARSENTYMEVLSENGIWVGTIRGTNGLLVSPDLPPDNEPTVITLRDMSFSPSAKLEEILSNTKVQQQLLDSSLDLANTKICFVQELDYDVFLQSLYLLSDGNNEYILFTEDYTWTQRTDAINPDWLPDTVLDPITVYAGQLYQAKELMETVVSVNEHIRTNIDK